MTVADSTVRRSQRSTTANRSSQYVSDLSDVDDIISEGKESSESDNDDDDDDEDYGKTKSHKRKASTKKAGNGKKRRAAQKSKIPATVDDLEDFVENYIFQALSATDISVSELATNWIEDYETNNSLALKDLINFLLRCCGCVAQIQEHDVENNESAVETVGEIQQVFTRQQFHEFPLLTTNSKWKNFKTNALDFVSEILSIANEKELLCTEEGDLMENLLTWLSTLSTSQARPLRYCSTIFLLRMETALCEIIAKSSTSFEKQQRQFDVESKKMKELKDKFESTKAGREKSKVEKEIKKVERRLDPITKSLKSYKDQKATLEEYLKDISNTTFVHRYRDIDPKIRQECMIALGQWVDILPEQFFETSYLRYFGWILSDKDPGVRLEVVKSLLRLYKKAVIVPGFRQFTERFKGRLIEMAIYDSDYNVRLSALCLILEVTKIGFLEDDEILKITSLIFCGRFNRVNLICTTESKFLRLQQELSRIIGVLEIEATKEFKDKFQVAIVNSEKALNIDINSIIRQKSLCQIMEKSFLYFTENYSRLETKTTSVNDKFTNAYKLIYILPSLESDTLFEFLYQYLTFDFSAADLVDSTLKPNLELSTFDSEAIFYFIAAITSLKIDAQSSQNNSILKLHHNPQKRREVVNGSSAIESDQIANKLISDLPQLLTMFKNSHLLGTLMKLFTMLLAHFKKQANSSKTELLHQISEKILSVYREADKGFLDEEMSKCFSDFFASLINEENDILQQKAGILVESLLAELSSELMFDLKQSTDLDPISPLALTASKLSTIGNCKDISENLELQDNDSGNSIIELLCDKCLKNEDYKSSEVPSLIVIFKLFSCHVSWKFEGLMADKQQLLLNDNFVISDALKSLIPIFNVTKGLSLENDLDDTLAVESSIFLMDLLVVMKAFQIKLTERLENLESDEKLADLKTFFEISIPLRVDHNLEKKLLRKFLVKEHELAQLIDIQLDRDEDEDVNFDTEKTEEEVDELKKGIEAENALCRFTIKLLALKKVGLLPENIYHRLFLNKDRLGSDLFNKLFESSTKKETPAEPETVEASQPTTVEVMGHMDEQDVDMQL